MLMEMTPDSTANCPDRISQKVYNCVCVCELAGNEFERSSCLSIMRLACSIGSQLQVTSGIIIALVEPGSGPLWPQEIHRHITNKINSK